MVSCAAEDVDLPAGQEVKIAAVALPSLDAPLLEREETLPLPEALALKMKDEPDSILASYRDPALRDGVLAFFQELTGSRDIASGVLVNASKHDIPPALAFALCWEESRYNPRAVNHNRNSTVDRGLFQLNSASFPKLKIEDFFDPSINAKYGLSHLRWCLDTAGTEVAALAMYNAGTNRVRSAGTPKVTLDYISRILKRQRKMEELFAAVSAGPAVAESGGTGEEQNPPFSISLFLTPGR